jgi:hypothetical protein
MSIQGSLSRIGKDPLNTVLARMVALDRLPFQTIARSADIKKGLIAQGYKAPNSDFCIRGAVSQYA